MMITGGESPLANTLSFAQKTEYLYVPAFALGETVRAISFPSIADAWSVPKRVSSGKFKKIPDPTADQMTLSPRFALIIRFWGFLRSWTVHLLFSFPTRKRCSVPFCCGDPAETIGGWPLTPPRTINAAISVTNVRCFISTSLLIREGTFSPDSTLRVLFSLVQQSADRPQVASIRAVVRPRDENSPLRSRVRYKAELFHDCQVARTSYRQYTELMCWRDRFEQPDLSRRAPFLFLQSWHSTPTNGKSFQHLSDSP